MGTIPSEEVRCYLPIPAEFTKGASDHLAVFIADGGNHFTHYGIFEGMFLIFDLEAEYEEGHLSFFAARNPDERHPKYKVSDVPMKGYRHMGRLVASVRNY